MKVVILTRKGLSLKLDLDQIKAPTLVLTNCNGNYYTFEYRGQQFEALHIGDVEVVQTLDLREKHKASTQINILPTPSKVETAPVSYPSAGTSFVPPGRSVELIAKQADRYRGEMIWSHKTAPEIVIRSSSGKMIKDVDTATMYKRR
jgi:hypothetical protein